MRLLKAAGAEKTRARQKSAKNAVNEEVSNNVEKQPNIVTPEGEKVEHLTSTIETDEANLKIVAKKNADGIIKEEVE